MNEPVRKLDGRTLYVLMRCAEQELRMREAMGIGFNQKAADYKELKSTYENARYVLEHVKFEVDQEHK